MLRCKHYRDGKQQLSEMHRQKQSLIRGRLVQEIRPPSKALCLACLRLPVIIIKAVSPTATAEQSSHLE